MMKEEDSKGEGEREQQKDSKGGKKKGRKDEHRVTENTRKKRIQYSYYYHTHDSFITVRDS